VTSRRWPGTLRSDLLEALETEIAPSLVAPVQCTESLPLDGPGPDWAIESCLGHSGAKPRSRLGQMGKGWSTAARVTVGGCGSHRRLPQFAPSRPGNRHRHSRSSAWLRLAVVHQAAAGAHERHWCDRLVLRATPRGKSASRTTARVEPGATHPGPPRRRTSATATLAACQTCRE
jgi:hypothetical protein